MRIDGAALRGGTRIVDNQLESARSQMTYQRTRIVKFTEYTLIYVSRGRRDTHVRGCISTCKIHGDAFTDSRAELLFVAREYIPSPCCVSDPCLLL